MLLLSFSPRRRRRRRRRRDLRVCVRVIESHSLAQMFHRRYAFYRIFRFRFSRLSLRLSASVVPRHGLWRCVDRAERAVDIFGAGAGASERDEQRG